MLKLLNCSSVARVTHILGKSNADEYTTPVLPPSCLYPSTCGLWETFITTRILENWDGGVSVQSQGELPSHVAQSKIPELTQKSEPNLGL